MTNEEIKELKEDNEPEAVDAYISIVGEEYATKEGFEESFQGKWSNDEDFVSQLLEDTGEIPKDLPPYIHIDMEWTAREIMMDYSEENGYYFRNL